MSESQRSGVANTSLLSKLHEAQKAATAVGKRGRNQKQNYSYARAEDVIREAQDALHNAGLVGAMTFSDVETSGVESKGGGAGMYLTLSGALRISDPDTGEAYEVPTFGAGIDYPGDKAVYKAMTGAAKYAYASALGIGFTDDPEKDDGRGTEDKPDKATPDEASKAQKASITRRCKELGIEAEHKPLLIKWVGEPLTKGRAGKLIELLKEAEDFPDVFKRAGLPNPKAAKPPAEGEKTLEDAVLEPGGAEALGLEEFDA